MLDFFLGGRQSSRSRTSGVFAREKGRFHTGGVKKKGANHVEETIRGGRELGYDR